MSEFANLLRTASLSAETQIAGNTIERYAGAFLIFLGLILAFSIFQNYIIWRLRKIASRTKTDLDDTILQVVESIRPPFYLIIAFFISLNHLSMSETGGRAVTVAIIALVVYQIIRVAQVIVDFVLMNVLLRESDDGTKSAVKTISQLIKGVLWGVGVLVVIQNIGINISSLLAGLGIGGIAIALAAQNVLGDLFSSFAIIFDKPFVPGDFIVVGEHAGVVEKIGIKTTRIRALQGEEIVISNQELTNSRIQNFKKLKERRVILKIGVAYATPLAKLKKIPEIIKKQIEKCDRTRFDRSHLQSFGDSALQFEAVYFVLSAEYIEYMNVQQKILLGVLKEFEQENIEIAYPTQTVFLKR